MVSLFTMVNLTLFVDKSITYPTFLVNFFAALLSLVAFRAIRDYRRRGGLPYPPRLADVRFGSGSAVSELNLDQTWRSGPGRTANLDLDLGSGPVRV